MALKYPIITYSGIKNKPWTLVEDFHIKLPNGDNMLVPKGYWTDFASIPRPLKVFVDHLGIDNPAFLIHDYMYNFGGYKTTKSKARTNKDVTRAFADKTMRQLQKQYGANIFRRWTFWKAVRFGGLFRFRKI